MAYLLGKNFAGILTEALLVCGRYVQTEAQGTPVALRVGRKAALVALHAMVLEPALFSSLRVPRLKNWTESFRSLESKLTSADTIRGALGVYDIEDLTRLIPPNKLQIDPA